MVVDAAATEAQRDSFTEFLRERGVNFWHHIVPLWLIADSSKQWDSLALRTEAKAHFPKVSLAVLKVSAEEWAIFAPVVGHQWMEENLP